MVTKGDPMVRTKAQPGEFQWYAWEDGIGWGTVLGKTVREGLDAAIATLDSEFYRNGILETMWVPVRVFCELTGEEGLDYVAIHPQEPPCIIGNLHRWSIPYGTWAGSEEDLAIGGAGPIHHEICSECGWHEFRNGYHTTPWGAEHQLRIWFTPPTEQSLSWGKHVHTLRRFAEGVTTDDKNG